MIKLILAGFFFQIVLMLISPVPFFDLKLIFALLLVSIVFLAFYSGYSLTNKRNVKQESVRENVVDRNPNLFLFLSFVSMLSGVYAASFYTGSYFEGYFNLINDVSNYDVYQANFANKSLGVLNASKIPAIMGSVYIKLFFLFAVYSFFFSKKTGLKALLVFLSILPIIHFSISRGTNYELLEISMFMLFSYFYAREGKRFLSVKRVLILFTLVSILLYIYNLNIGFRYASSGGYVLKCQSSMCVDKKSFMFQLAPDLSLLIYKLNAYFSFGYLYFATLLQELVSHNPYWLFFPVGFIDETYQPRFLCENKVLSCGAMWSPSIEFYVYNLGYVGFLLFVFFLGHLTRSLVILQQKETSFFRLLLIYYVFLGMFSLPVGHLLSASSANVLIIFIAICYLFFRGLRK